MGQPEAWKSPRKIEEEVNQYRAKRFEDYMVMVDEGKIERHLAIAALREEIIYSDVKLGEAEAA